MLENLAHAALHGLIESGVAVRCGVITSMSGEAGGDGGMRSCPLVGSETYAEVSVGDRKGL